VLQVVVLYKEFLTSPVDQIAVVSRRKLRDIGVLDESIRTVHKAYLHQVVVILPRVEAHSLVVAVILRQPSRVGQVVSSNSQVIDKDSALVNVSVGHLIKSLAVCGPKIKPLEDS
jgi:hypothetical protein